MSFILADGAPTYLQTFYEMGKTFLSWWGTLLLADGAPMSIKVEMGRNEMGLSESKLMGLR